MVTKPGESCVAMSVLDRQVFGQVSMESCELYGAAMYKKLRTSNNQSAVQAAGKILSDKN